MENYTSDSSDADSNEVRTLDLSYLTLSTEILNKNLLHTSPPENVEIILLNQNRLSTIPSAIVRFANLKMLDVSNCGLTQLSDLICHLNLNCLVAKNNELTNESLPKCFQSLSNLRELNLNGNRLTRFPEQVLDLVSLKYLYLGGNAITNISQDVAKLHKLVLLLFCYFYSYYLLYLYYCFAAYNIWVWEVTDWRKFHRY